MHLLLKALTLTPLPLLHAYAWIIYVIGFYVLRWRRTYTERDIANAFPEASATLRAAILRRSYRNAADTLTEAFWGYGAEPEALKERVTIENPEVIRRCEHAGQSVVLLTAHYANWEWLLLAAGVHFGIPINVVYQHQRVSSIDAFLQKSRARFGSSLIPREDFIYELMARAGKARTYALIADQTPRPEHPKIWTRFLHQDTAFFVGAGKVARFLDAPVIYVRMRRLARGRYSIRFIVLAEPPYADGEDVLIVERYAATLESEIRASPADWLWLQKKWKYPKPTPPAAAGTAATEGTPAPTP
ncbi:MAG: lysophospholipid acyltransferase family protein [Betaproteobacteria bacterium]